MELMEDTQMSADFEIATISKVYVLFESTFKVNYELSIFLHSDSCDKLKDFLKSLLSL